MRNLPEAFTQEMADLLGEEYPAYLASFDAPRLYGLRVNTLKISAEDFLKICPFPLKPVSWAENGFYVREEDKPSRHPYYYAGLYYLQEPSAMLPASILPVEKYDRVLDTCAAPGGKSTRLAEKLSGTGLLFSNDISNSRALALLKNLELFGAKNAVILTEDLKKLGPSFNESFDSILIDAPCSGEGMFRKDPSVIRSWEEHGHDFYIALQRSITAEALRLLKPGGHLLYSTCTFSVREDEDIVLYMKSLCPELSVVSVPDLPKELSGGLPEKAEHYDAELSNCIRIFPHRAEGEGHFAALLKKGEGGMEDKGTPGHLKRTKKAASLSSETREFLKHIRIDFIPEGFEIRNGRVYYLPEDLPELKGLRILRSGLFIGEEKKNRFEPSQALAAALREQEFDFTVSLPWDDPRVIRYLKGETIDVNDVTNRSGWVLFCTDHFPLGFAKSGNGILKNKYLKGWRYLS